MTDPDAYVRNIDSINESIKRHNGQLKILRTKKLESQERLAIYMEKHGIEEYKGYKLAKIKPKQKLPQKKKKEKKSDAIKLFSEIGVDDPEALWEEFQRTQKYKLPSSDGEDTS
jgi:hypothetical protein